MNGHCFDMMWRNVQWIHNTDVQGEVTSHEDHRWKLVEDFVNPFNDYCTQIFSPSDLICDNESISQRYRKGGHWINLGFPMYVAMERKPDNGVDIHNASCRRSGIMMRISIVKSARIEADQEDDEDNLPHVAKVMK